jgi:GNAT superfamily N-acetyltransferase
MLVDTRDESVFDAHDYMRVPIAVMVKSRFRIVLSERGLGGLHLVEEQVVPYVKDYDGLDGGPTSWPTRWDMSQWGIIGAYHEGERVGGAVLAWRTKDLIATGNRDDTVALWDLRVAPVCRGAGVGTSLFQHAVAWARDRSCRWLKVETQNINVPACRFYAKQGCELVSLDRFAYPHQPDEVQLVWALSL